MWFFCKNKKIIFFPFIIRQLANAVNENFGFLGFTKLHIITFDNKILIKGIL